jgi:hypothetical protein
VLRLQRERRCQQPPGGDRARHLPHRHGEHQIRPARPHRPCRGHDRRDRISQRRPGRLEHPRINIQRASQRGERPTQRPGPRFEPTQPPPHRRGRSFNQHRDTPVTPTRRRDPQRRTDHLDRIRPPKQTVHRQQPMSNPTTQTPRPARPQPPPNQTVPPHNPGTAIPPRRQPITTARAAQLRRGQPDLDPGRIAAYREHGVSAHHRWPFRQPCQDAREDHPPTGTSSPRRRTPNPLAPPTATPTVPTPNDANPTLGDHAE